MVVARPVTLGNWQLKNMAWEGRKGTLEGSRAESIRRSWLLPCLAAVVPRYQEAKKRAGAFVCRGLSAGREGGRPGHSLACGER